MWLRVRWNSSSRSWNVDLIGVPLSSCIPHVSWWAVFAFLQLHWGDRRDVCCLGSGAYRKSMVCVRGQIICRLFPYIWPSINTNFLQLDLWLWLQWSDSRSTYAEGRYNPEWSVRLTNNELTGSFLSFAIFLSASVELHSAQRVSIFSSQIHGDGLNIRFPHEMSGVTQYSCHSYQFPGIGSQVSAASYWMTNPIFYSWSGGFPIPCHKERGRAWEDRVVFVVAASTSGHREAWEYSSGGDISL
jgi:hypothetical protein